MKRIINGIRYNTDTATHVANRSYSNRNDLNYYNEGLFLTDSGRWFLAGEGGPSSKYSVCIGFNSWSGGSAISELNPDEAFELLQHWEETDACETYFADRIKK